MTRERSERKIFEEIASKGIKNVKLKKKSEIRGAAVPMLLHPCKGPF